VPNLGCRVERPTAGPSGLGGSYVLTTQVEGTAGAQGPHSGFCSLSPQVNPRDADIAAALVCGPIAEIMVCGGDVGAAAESDDVDRRVAQGGHDVRALAGAHAGAVLTLGDITGLVQAVLDRPVRADPVGQQPRIGVAVAQGGDGVHRLHQGFAWPAHRRRRTSLIARAPCGNSPASGVPSRSRTLIERDSLRPCPACRSRSLGTPAQGSRASARRSVGWFPVTVNR
jgi:hypothetical protein